MRVASLDGDADRLIYFFFDQERKFHMLDGDKIAILIASHLRTLLNEAKVENLTLGLVQSAYANGSSTNYAISMVS
jgi:phosphoacetylglucosamine mutase